MPMKKFKNILSIFVLAAFIGYAGFLLYEGASPKEADASSDTEDLVQIIEEQEADIASWEEAIRQVNANIEDEFDQQTQGITTIGVLKDSLYQARYHAGLTEMSGSGILLSLRDNTEKAEEMKKTQPEDYRPDDYILHDKNLLYIVNDLKKARPLGLAINDQRLVTSSNIRCVGTVILVNDRRLAPPYNIRILGDAEEILEEMRASNELSYLLEQGFPISYQEQEDILLPAYAKTSSLNYASLYVAPQETVPDQAEEIIEVVENNPDKANPIQKKDKTRDPSPPPASQDEGDEVAQAVEGSGADEASEADKEGESTDPADPTEASDQEDKALPEVEDDNAKIKTDTKTEADTDTEDSGPEAEEDALDKEADHAQ